MMSLIKNAFLWIRCLRINFLIMVASVQGVKIVRCLLSRVAKMWCLLFTLAKIACCLLTLMSFVLHSCNVRAF